MSDQQQGEQFEQAPADVEVLVPRYSSDPADAWGAAETLARLNAGGA